MSGATPPLSYIPLCCEQRKLFLLSYIVSVARKYDTWKMIKTLYICDNTRVEDYLNPVCGAVYVSGQPAVCMITAD